MGQPHRKVRILPSPASSKPNRAERLRRDHVVTGLQYGQTHRDESLMTDVLATVQAICDNAPLSVRQAKKSIHHGLQMDLKRDPMFETKGV